MRIHRENINASTRRSEAPVFSRDEHHHAIASASSQLWTRFMDVSNQWSLSLAAARTESVTLEQLEQASRQLQSSIEQSHSELSRDVNAQLDQQGHRLNGAIQAIAENTSRMMDCYEQLTLMRQTSDGHSADLVRIKQDVVALSQSILKMGEGVVSSDSSKEFLEYKKVTDERLEKLVKLFLSISI